jgi:hypothetical protein
MSDVGCLMSEGKDRGQRSEVGGRREEPEVRGQRSEVGETEGIEGKVQSLSR